MERQENHQIRKGTVGQPGLRGTLLGLRNWNIRRCSVSGRLAAGSRRTVVTDTRMALLSQVGNRSEVTRISGFGSRRAARYQGIRQKQGQMGSRDQEPVVRNTTESRSRVKESQGSATDIRQVIARFNRIWVQEQLKISQDLLQVSAPLK